MAAFRPIGAPNHGDGAYPRPPAPVDVDNFSLNHLWRLTLRKSLARCSTISPLCSAAWFG